MLKFSQTLALVVAVALAQALAVDVAPTNAISIAPKSVSWLKMPATCQSSSGTPGYSVSGQTRGSMVILCANFVAQQNTVVTLPSKPPKPVAPRNPAKPVAPRKPASGYKHWAKPKVLHRKKTANNFNAFSPLRLVIEAEPKIAVPGQKIILTIKHQRQFRTAYLLGRFVALRFTPLSIRFSPISINRRRLISPDQHSVFSGSVSFSSPGRFRFTGVVSYESEYRINGSRNWNRIEGVLRLAAIPAVIEVADSLSHPSTKRVPYLVENDCLLLAQNLGCLN